MTNSTRRRLTTTEFMALRSIAREPWSEARGAIQWKFHRQWVHLHRDDRWRYGSLIARAWDAAENLEKMGLVVRVAVRRCCNDPKCQEPKHDEIRLSESGELLLGKANSATPAPAVQRGEIDAQDQAEMGATPPPMRRLFAKLRRAWLDLL